MLGGILRALLAICFSKVVFPLLKKEVNNNISVRRILLTLKFLKGINKPIKNDCLPVWPNQTISTPRNNQQVGVDKELLSMGGYAKPLQLRENKCMELHSQDIYVLSSGMKRKQDLGVLTLMSEAFSSMACLDDISAWDTEKSPSMAF